MSEDCLHLNLWTPALRDRGERPVMVWFHPGGYSSGTSNETEADGARLSRRGDVVVVTVNHRINAFGHLYLAELGGDEFADSGNVGILDLILALRWVRDNIDEFGGNPRNVTIFGQSGGGAKSATLMAMPEAQGLFHRVITMSGQQITASRMTTATRHAEQLLAALALPRERVKELRLCPDGATDRSQPGAGLSGPGEGRTFAAARSLRSRCAATVGIDSDDPRQHQRRNTHAHRTRRSIDIRPDVGDTAGRSSKPTLRSWARSIALR